MPSPAAVLGFSKSERDILGGWSAEGSQRYTRTAKYKIKQMQTAVASTFRNSEPDQLAEADDIDSLGDFLRTWEVPEDSVRRSQKMSMFALVCTDLERSDSPKPTTVDFDVIPGELALDNHDEDAELQNKLSKEKQQSGNRSRSELLGSDHKQARSDISIKVAGRLLHIALGEEGHPGGTLFGTLLHAPWSRLFIFFIRWLAVPGFR